MMKLVAKKHLCTGCMLCESACSLSHDGVLSPGQARVQIWRGPALNHTYRINVCRQCKLCPPIDACPAGAISRHNKTGAIIINYDTCTPDCLICAEACHLDAIVQTSGNQPIVCDLCGGDPQCVKMCEPVALDAIGVKMVGTRVRKRQDAL